MKKLLTLILLTTLTYTYAQTKKNWTMEEVIAQQKILKEQQAKEKKQKEEEEKKLQEEIAMMNKNGPIKYAGPFWKKGNYGQGIHTKEEKLLYNVQKSANACNLKYVKELIESGQIDKNAEVGPFRQTLYDVTTDGRSKECGEVARWLSSIGVEDVIGRGWLTDETSVPPYKKPLVMEDKRVKIEFTRTSTGGELQGTFLNKTDKPVKIIYEENNINGYKYTAKDLTRGKKGILIGPNEKLNEYSDEEPDEYLMPIDTPYGYCRRNFDDAEKCINDAPKVINNKVTINRGETIVKYIHDNKEYTLKLPARKEVHDVYYQGETVPKSGI